MAANDVNLNNPAGRLHRILSRAKSSGATHALQAYATAFEVSANDVPQILFNLGQSGLNVDEVSKELKRLNATDTLELFAESAPHLKSALSLQNLGIAWESVKSQIRDEDLRALRYCSKDLAKVSVEEVLSDEQLKDLKSKVDALYEEVISSKQVDPGLRQVILGHLDSILRAVHGYRVTGLRPLAEALTITAFTAAQPAKKGRSNTKKNKPAPESESKILLDKLRVLVKYAGELTKLWKFVHPVLGFAKDHLPLLKDGYEKLKNLLPPPQ